MKPNTHARSEIIAGITAVLRKRVLPVLLAAVWIVLSEFFRNEIFLKSYWTDHYKNLGIPFPSDPVNNAVWILWSVCFAIIVYFLSRKFSLMQTTILSWFIVFILMWIVIGNLGVLPAGLLWFAIPLSLLETFFAAFIIKKYTG